MGGIKPAGTTTGGGDSAPGTGGGNSDGEGGGGVLFADEALPFGGGGVEFPFADGGDAWDVSLGETKGNVIKITRLK